MLSPAEFTALAAQGYTRIPLVVETAADLETPLSIYLKLCGQKPGSSAHSFLLESVHGGERFGRYSFIGLPARQWLTATGFGAAARTHFYQDGQLLNEQSGNPLDVIAAEMERHKVYLPAGMPRFCGGLAGYFGYDTVRHIERKLEKTCPPDTLGTPDIMLLQCDELAVIDNLKGRLQLIVWAQTAQADAYAQAQARLQAIQAQLQAPAQLPPLNASAHASAQAADITREFAKEDYLRSTHQAKELIAAGDFMQVQVGQRMHLPFAHAPIHLYRALRQLNPSPYMYYYDMGDFQIVGTSPEILVRQEACDYRGEAAQKITIRPLAGTRPRAATPEEDKAREAELLADPKERAEHVMLIDLARNDIGRIARTGSVQVTEAFVVERYSHVMHIVSNVEGVLNPGMRNMDVLRASFPAGTLTGAPKVHAMELIDQLEPSKRGIYGGACGYISYGGDMDVAIAIRTGIVKGGQLYVQAAAGIVADSVPELEWQETEAKSRALIRAAEVVQQGQM
jgi:anthranilate synthase component 1